MANPTNNILTVQTINAGLTTMPTGETVDTAGDLTFTVTGPFTEYLVVLTNTNAGAVNQTFTLKAGGDVATRATGDLASGNIAQNAVKLLRIDGSKFKQAGGTVKITFAAATNLAWNVKVLRLSYL